MSVVIQILIADDHELFGAPRDLSLNLSPLGVSAAKLATDRSD